MLHRRPRSLPLRHAALAVAAASTALLFAVAPEASTRPQVGLMDPAYAATQPDRFWDDVRVLRPSFLRYDVHWNAIAPTKPRRQRDPADPAYRWGYLDDVLTQAAKHGYARCDVIATVWRTPRWATPLRPYNYANMPRLQAFRNFVAALATRYSGTYDPDGAGPARTLPRLACWEIWNEPNFNGALRPQKRHGRLLSPANYVRLLNVARAELRRAGRVQHVRQVVIAGALYRQRSPKGVGPVAFMEAMHARNARFDVLSIHPYNGIPRLGLRDGAGVGSVWPNVAIGNFGRFEREVRRLWPKGRFPIWVTEFGWQTRTGRHDQYAVSERQQARFLRQSITRFRTQHRRVARITWFLVKDEPTTTQDGRRNTWQSGFRRVDGSRKPSFAAWRRLQGVVMR